MLFWLVIPETPVKITEKQTATERNDEKEEAAANLETEQQKIAAQREKLRQEKELFEQRKALAEEHRKLEEERKQLAMAKRLDFDAANEIGRDGRFIAYKNGTVLDTKTNLMWAAKNNGANINWQEAKNYCDNYSGGGYTDWRMPSQDELAGLYDAGRSQEAECQSSYQNHVVTDLIHLTCFAHWASETRGSEAARFDFGVGNRAWVRQSYGDYFRVLPVRSIQKDSAVKEIRSDGRFIAYDNGTVLDTKTNLMWAARDNGSKIKWPNAKSYCEDYRGGGYMDWRMPTLEELAGLYDNNKSRPARCDTKYYIHLTELIDVSCFTAWAFETRSTFFSDNAAIFDYVNGNRGWGYWADGYLNRRALPVRFVK